MNNKPITQAENPLLHLASFALARAAKQARQLAAQTGTALVIRQNGEMRRIYPALIPEDDANTGQIQ